MCITAVALNSHPNYRFLLLFNRDEAFERPTSELAEWADEWEGIIAGRDLMGGGTWLGINRDGKFVALTNFTDEDLEILQQQQANPSASLWSVNSHDYLTRGMIPLRILRKNVNIYNELQDIWTERSRYKSFNLLAGDIKSNEVYYLSVNQAENAFAGLRRLDEGVHCMSNTDISNPWDKTTRLKADLERFLKNNDSFSTLDLIPLLITEINLDEPAEKEASIFIKAYPGDMFGTPATRGTVSSTIITLNTSQEVTILERTWSKDQLFYSDTHKSFLLPNNN